MDLPKEMQERLDAADFKPYFDIISGVDRPMYPGQIIQYIVTPILGIKTKWVRSC